MPTAIQGSLSVRVTADGYRTRAIRQGLHGLVWLNGTTSPIVSPPAAASLTIAGTGVAETTPW